MRLKWGFNSHLRFVVGALLLIMNYSVRADTVLLNPATMAVGTSVGEFLVVKESCPDPSKTNCQANEKMKYVTAVAGRIGKIEFAVNLTDNFELDVNMDLADFIQQSIILFKTDNTNASSLYVQFKNGTQIGFDNDYRNNSYNQIGWQSGNSINNVELAAKNGIAYLSINGIPFKDNGGNEGDAVSLDISKPYVKLVITGIKEADRLFEVTLKGETGKSH